MEFLKILFNSSVVQISVTEIWNILLVVFVLSALEFCVYKVLYSNAFYNRAFHINIAIIPFFISTIILALQSNFLITLGTIGALAIIRYRTAVKNPSDMIFLLWAIHIGITCGCKLFQIAVITSLVVTVVLFILNKFKKLKYPYCCVIHSKENLEADIKNIMSNCSKKYKIKNRSYTGDGYNYVIELYMRKIDDLTKILEENKKIEKFSILEYDYEDIL